MLEVSWWFLYFRFSRPGWGSYLGIPVNEPCPFQQLPRGLGSCPEASTSIRRPRRATWVPWGTSCVSTPRAWRGRMEKAAASELVLEDTKQIQAFHKLGIFLVKSGLVRVPLDRLGSWPRGTTKLLWRHLRVQGRLSFRYPRFVYMNQVPDCRQSVLCGYVVTLRVFLLPDGVWWLSHPSHRIDLAGHQQKCQSHLIPHTSSATCFGNLLRSVKRLS